MAKKDIGNLKIIRSVELVPSRTSSLSDIIDAGNLLADLSDMFTAPENPRGLPGIDPVIALYEATRNNNIIPMPHITPRDKNALFIRSQAITAMKFGINHFFVIGGDPISPDANSKEVREIDVMETITEINQSRKLIKSRDGDQSEIVIGSAINPYRSNEEEIALKKMEHGSRLFISQIIFDPQLLEKEWIKKRNFKIMAGFMAIRKKSQVDFAEKLHINMSAEVREKFQYSDDIESTSRRVILETFDSLKGYVDGIHIMPLGHNNLAKDILECI
ncbi:methylenetetrahydrofolate reductase [Oxyplasma meridianum]|uniref:Methylenetetrahydrofolate reductase n=1 Tax=Oxyplasma meridianum TaxID=3073602 RepID=A0AAX4NIH5_9ARCH